MLFLTSFSPDSNAYESQSIAIKTIQQLPGSRLISFNHSSEAVAIRKFYPTVEVYTTHFTAEALYKKPYVRINAFLNWVKNNKDIETFTLINSDIVIDSNPKKWSVIEEIVKGGTHIICKRYDFDNYGDIMNAKQQEWGIDMFVLNRKHLKFLDDDIYAMGQPYWDYWLPFSLFSNGVRVMKIFNTKLIFHKLHKQRWADNTWHVLARHFALTVAKKKVKLPFQDDYQFAMSVYNDIMYNSEEVNFEAKYPDTHILFRNILSKIDNPIIFDIGAHMYQDARTLAYIKDSTVYAFEPDIRTTPEKLPPNVIMERLAIGAENKIVPMFMSEMHGPVPWTQSSSIKKPTGHKNKYPSVSFKNKQTDVQLMKLDTYCKEKGIKKIDLIHADIQGAEMDFLIGAKNILKKTKYLYIEYSDEQLYEGQPNLKQIQDFLPEWSIVEDLKTDVLLKNDPLFA
tara:strand:+ start:1894 stop:3255 length:1362 start_codon:yes stop_codon:yes gene_type:complete